MRREGGKDGERDGEGGPPESPPGAVKGRWEMGKGEDPEANPRTLTSSLFSLGYPV